MSQWLAGLSQGPGKTLGTVVHLGAGSTLEQPVPWRAQRLVLVEGDPRAAQRLRDLARRAAGTEVVEQVVAAEQGTLTWHTFNLPRFNGPYAPSSLLARYPRLRVIDERPVPSTALGELAVLSEPRSGQFPDVLVVDLPGQELPLLSSLKESALHRFAWILVRSCALDGNGGADELATLLAARSYRPAQLKDPGDPLWPVQLFRLDEMRARMKRQRRLNDTLQARVLALQTEMEKLRAVAATARERESDMQQSIDRLLSERTLLAEADVKARAALRADADAKAAQLEMLDHEHRSLLQTHAAMASEHEQLGHEVKAQSELAEAQRLELDALERRAAQLECERREADRRQLLLREELSRAEAQLDVIKDLLLRKAAP